MAAGDCTCSGRGDGVEAVAAEGLGPAPPPLQVVTDVQVRLIQAHGLEVRIVVRKDLSDLPEGEES